MKKEITKQSPHSKSVSLRRKMFAEDAVPPESRRILENFDKIIADVRSLSGKQEVSLYGAIKALSHQLTDERSDRRIGYMNEAKYISSYIHYFMWWNLVRLTRLFANLPKSAFKFAESQDGAVAIDAGSGPLTVPIALWLARPELRSKKIKWYCMDLSQTVLSAGEDLYLKIAAETARSQSEALSSSSAAQSQSEAQTQSAESPWQIVRVKGPLGTSIKEKADFIVCANAFNEILQRSEQPTDFLAKKYTQQLLDYLKEETAEVLLIEPGDPHSARFISLMRDALLRRNFVPVAPCTHTAECPMAGRTHGKTTNQYGKNAKWCNFAFNTQNAPARLLKLSEKAGLNKERASLSFVLSVSTPDTESRTPDTELSIPGTKRSTPDTERSRSAVQSEKTFIRIASDFIRLPELHKSGYYACSQFGMLLAIDEHHVQPENGELLQIKTPENLSERDKKSGALIVKI